MAYNGYEGNHHWPDSQPAVAIVGVDELPGGAHVDAAVRYPAWTRETVDLIIRDKLRGFTLGFVLTFVEPGL